MKRAAEIIHIAAENRKEYLNKYINPSAKTAQILWECGIRKQFYYEFGEEILRPYEYTGKQFSEDMDAISNHKETEDFFLRQRRKDVPIEKRQTTNWWVPLKWCGASLMSEPAEEDAGSLQEQYHRMMSGDMAMEEEQQEHSRYTYDEDDWSESVHM